MAKEIKKDKFDWDAFTSRHGERIVVHCQTEEEAKQFCKIMHERGLRWCNGERYIDNEHYFSHKERTYYSGIGKTGSIDFANERGYTVLKFSLLDFETESKDSTKSSSSLNYKMINSYDDWLFEAI